MKNLNEISQKSLEIVKNTGILSPYNEVGHSILKKFNECHFDFVATSVFVDCRLWFIKLHSSELTQDKWVDSWDGVLYDNDKTILIYNKF